MEMFLVVLSNSPKTVWAFVLAFVSLLSFYVVGDMMVSGLDFQGVLAPMTDVARERLMSRFEKAGWVSFFGFLVVAVRCFRKDYRRLMR